MQLGKYSFITGSNNCYTVIGTVTQRSIPLNLVKAVIVTVETEGDISNTDHFLLSVATKSLPNLVILHTVKRKQFFVPWCLMWKKRSTFFSVFKYKDSKGHKI